LNKTSTSSHRPTHELLLLSLVLDLDDGLSSLVNDLVRPVLHVRLNVLIRELSSDKSLGVEDGVVRVHSDLVLGGITDETLSVVESDVRRGGSVSLVVGDDFNSGNVERYRQSPRFDTTDQADRNLPVLSEDSDTRVGGSEIDTDSSSHFDVVFVSGLRFC
jgi:hypothetical protein